MQKSESWISSWLNVHNKNISRDIWLWVMAEDFTSEEISHRQCLKILGSEIAKITKKFLQNTEDN
jgi:hypothetical protein